uniref:Zinc knuckle CX2CX4HX4C n=1 Tax=Tanacetum cinerariifolium TaxID=118510 RepID=A0A699HSA5_TANCI|nr:hypothetical protein [Tanacetum cinerariifolium]
MIYQSLRKQLLRDFKVVYTQSARRNVKSWFVMLNNGGLKERGFLSQKGSRVGRGVKDKDLNGNKRNTTLGGCNIICGRQDGGDGKISSLEDITVLGSFPSLSTPSTTMGNGIDVVVPVESIRAINERFANTAYGFFLRKKLAYLLLLTMSSYARAMTELQTDVELKDNIIMAMPKLTGEGHYICNVHVEYEWKPPRCASCKVFGHIHEEYPKNTSVDKKKTMKKPSQTSQGVPIGSKIGFKPQKEYRHVPKKPTASSSGNRKKGVVPTVEVSNSNPFEVLNSVNNDVKLGTNGKTINLKFEELLTSRKATLVDEAGNPLKNVEYPNDYDSEDEVASVDNDMAHFMASKRVGFGTQSLLE